METYVHRVTNVIAGEIQRFEKPGSGGKPFSSRSITILTSSSETLELTLIAAESDSLIIKGE